MGQERRRVPAVEPVDKGLRMRMAALAGAAYHSHGAPHPDAPYFLRPLSLDQVVGHLVDEEPGIRLQGAAWLLDGDPHPKEKSGLHAAAQRVLGPSVAVGDLVTHLEGEAPAIRGRAGIPRPCAEPLREGPELSWQSESQGVRSTKLSSFGGQIPKRS